MAARTLNRIKANRARRHKVINETDAELPGLVVEAFEDGHTWQEIADALGKLTKQRVYQLRAAGLRQREDR